MMWTRCAVVWRMGGEFDLTTARIERPSGDDVLVRIEAAGMCHADILRPR